VRNEIDSEKLRNTVDEFGDRFLRSNAVDRIGFQPITAGQKQPFKGYAERRIGIKVSRHQANSCVISIGSRRVIASNGIAQTVYEGLQEKPISGRLLH
jgi:hypothetical protein